MVFRRSLSIIFIIVTRPCPLQAISPSASQISVTFFGAPFKKVLQGDPGQQGNLFKQTLCRYRTHIPCLWLLSNIFQLLYKLFLSLEIEIDLLNFWVVCEMKIQFWLELILFPVWVCCYQQLCWAVFNNTTIILPLLVRCAGTCSRHFGWFQWKRWWTFCLNSKN